VRRPGLVSGYLGGKLFELALILIWLGLALLARGERAEVRYLVVGDAVAGLYLFLGILVMRRQGIRSRPVGQADVAGWLRPFSGPHFEFGCVLAASLAGLTGAVTVTNAHGSGTKVAGAVTIFLAWMLLHAGYARFYAGLYYQPEGSEDRADSRGQLQFPADDRPTSVDFLYFSFTLGTSFAVSDVTVTTPAMRWHVMVHSVLSFFYNAVVLALAIGILINR